MNTGRALAGATFVAIGGLALLDRAEVLDAGRVIADWWPVLLLLGALLDLVARPPRVAGAIVLGGLGVVLLGITTDVVDASVWELVWPLGLVALGVWLLVRRPASRPGNTASPDERIDTVAVFSGRRVVNTAPRFRGGSATAVFGGVEVDLTGATIDEVAVLDAVALFGGIDVEVPPGWRVVVDGPVVFGGHESHVPPPTQDGAPTLHVRGTAIFGGIDVKARASPTSPVLTAADG